MAMGPVQLMAVGFDHPDFRGEIVAELVRLSDAGLVRLLDAVAVVKDGEGEVTVLEASELSLEDMSDLGATVGALVGLGMGGEEGALAGAVAGAEAAESGHLLDSEDIVDVLEEIEPDTAAAIVLLEHRWAIPLRDAIVAANGYPIVDMWVHPLELAALGELVADALEDDDADGED